MPTVAAKDNNMRRADAANIAHKLYFDSNARFVVHFGQSQYSDDGGASSCGIAAFNAARIVLGREKTGIRSDKLLSNILTEETMEVSSPVFTRYRRSSHDLGIGAGDPISVLTVVERQPPRCRNYL